MDETPTRPPDPDEAGTSGTPDTPEPVPNQLSGMAAETDEELASTFAPGLDPETLNFGLDKPLSIVCQWCNAPLDDPSVSTCPHCGAALQPADPDVEVPGLTTMSPDARAAQMRVERKLREASEGRSLSRSLLAGGTEPLPTPVAAEVLGTVEEAAEAGSYQPPPQDVHEVILRMELEALMARQEIVPPLATQATEEVAAGDETQPAEGAAESADAEAPDTETPDAEMPDAAPAALEARPVDDTEAEGARGDREPA